MKTKTLTKGAMLVAIIGALLLINKQLGVIVSDVAPLMVTPFVMVYSDNLKEKCILSVSFIILGFLLGDITAHIYIPAGVLVGLLLSVLLKKNLSGKRFVIYTILAFSVVEIAVVLLIYPLLGTSLMQQVEGSAIILNKLHIPCAYPIAIICLLLTAIVIAVIESIAALTLYKYLRRIS